MEKSPVKHGRTFHAYTAGSQMYTSHNGGWEEGIIILLPSSRAKKIIPGIICLLADQTVSLKMTHK